MATGGAATHHFNASKLFDVSQYVCLITGGGTGIGLMAAQALAANGAKVSPQPFPQRQGHKPLWNLPLTPIPRST